MMPTADASVRPAGPEDAGAMAGVQVRAWRQAYAQVLTGPALETMTGDEAERSFAQHWEQSIDNPPSSHHRALVALEGREVSGLAAYGPSADDDRWPRTDAELLTLLVDPDRQRRGHGSRLLNATVDLLREDGFQTISVWAFADDDALLGFLESAGWSPDGSRRELDMSAAGADVPLMQVRLASRIA